MKYYLIAFEICISLLTNEVEHMFIGLLVILFYEDLVSRPFSTICLFLNFLNSLYILKILKIYVCNYIYITFI